MAIVNVPIEEFLRNGCKCSIGPNNSQCLNAFSREQFIECRDQMTELSNEEKDMLLLGFFMINRTPKRQNNINNHGYKIYGFDVCKTTFLYVLNISNTKYKNIAAHYNLNGLISREHGNKGRLPVNTTPFEETEHVTSFIKAYARDNALPLPGRVPGHSLETHLVISSSITKKDIFQQYTQVSLEASLSPVKYSLFLELWNSLVPWIVIAKPSSDLCWTCQKFSETLYRTPNLDVHVKAEMTLRYQQHLDEKEKNRIDYNTKVEEAARFYQTVKHVFSPFQPPPPCSVNGVAF